jgi:hypothetical protein
MVPGPGAYRLKSSIGDVPEYAIQGRKDEHKYVWIISMVQAYK